MGNFKFNRPINLIDFDPSVREDIVAVDTVKAATTNQATSIANLDGMYKNQFLNKDDVIDGYWTNTTQELKPPVEGTAYKCFKKPIWLPAGTHYYKNVDRTFSSVKYADGTIKKLSELGATANGSSSFTTTEDGILCATVNLSATDFATVRLCNFDYPATSAYFYGAYSSVAYGQKNFLNIMKTQIKSFNKKVIVVDAAGEGDYTNLQDAIDNCGDSSTNPVVIKLMNGNYPLFTMSPVGEVVRYISIIGESRELCIVQSDTGDYTLPAAEINTNGTIENITFISTYNKGVAGSVADKNCYAVHLDYAGAKTQKFKNCKFVSYCAPGVGMGIRADEITRFDDCIFECHASDTLWGTKGLGAFFFHNSDVDSSGSKLILNNCEFYNTNGTKALLGSFTAVGAVSPTIQITKCLFNGSLTASIDTEFTLANVFGNSAELTIVA